MELLKKLNEAIWTQIFNFCSALTDNVSLAIFLTSFVAAVLCLAFRRKILKTKRLFGAPEALYILSVSHMVSRLPMVHERIHTALSTTAGIILQSDTYMAAFSQISGINNLTSKKIASYLYFSDLSAFENAEPDMLYEHLIKTLNDTRDLLFFWQVHEKTWTPVLFILVGVLALVLVRIKMKLLPAILYYIFQLAVLILTIWNNGAFYAAALIIIFEIGLTGILNTKIQEE